MRCSFASCPARLGALGRNDRVDIKHERERRSAATHRDSVGSIHRRTVDAVGKRLIARGRVDKAVAHNDLARGERRLNALVHKLGAGRGVKQKLAGIAHLSMRGVEQKGADLLGDGHAAWLAQGKHVVTRLLERRDDECRLRGFTASVDTLHGDERGRGRGKRSC